VANDVKMMRNWVSALNEVEKPFEAGRDQGMIKRNVSDLYNRLTAFSTSELWNWGYYDEELMELARERIPGFGRTWNDGLSELLYLLTLQAVPIGFDRYAGKSVLEVGCGNGKGLNFLSRVVDGPTLIGLDIAEDAIDQATVDLSRGAELRFVHGDAEDLPFGDGELDVVVNVESAHNYPSPAKFLTEVSRVLKPGGYFSHVDVYTANRFAEMELAKKSAPDLEWIVERDISDGVKAAVRQRLAPDSVFRRLKQGTAPHASRLTRVMLGLAFQESWGGSFAGIPEPAPIRLLQTIVRTEKERIPFSHYQLSVAAKV
jgi:ubiquinone/menaquinone biosynthesis C-methylase UbiE